jgi:hypothetical protein
LDAESSSKTSRKSLYKDFVVDVFHNPKRERYIFIIKRLPSDEIMIELYNNNWQRLDIDKAGTNLNKKDGVFRLYMEDFDPGNYFVRMISGDQYLIKKIDVK